MQELRKRNLASASEHAQVVCNYLAAECAAGRVIGPLAVSDFSEVHVSSFGVIPKETPGKWRLIVDLSSPEERSVNDGVSEHLCLVQYVMVDDAALVAGTKGQGAMLVKVDIAHTYT